MARRRGADDWRLVTGDARMSVRAVYVLHKSKANGDVKSWQRQRQRSEVRRRECTRYSNVNECVRRADVLLCLMCVYAYADF